MNGPRQPNTAPPSAAGLSAWTGSWRAPIRRGRLPHIVLLGALTLGWFMTAPAQAQQSVRFLSAGMLHERLFSDDPFVREAGKHYVLGVLDTLALRRDPRVCLGPELEANDLVVVVMRHLAARPEMHRYNAGSFVREAVATEFPCI